MEIAILITSVSALAVIIFVSILVYWMQKQNDLLRNQVNSQLNEVNKQLLKTTGQIGERLDGTSQVLGDVQKGLGEMGEASKQIYSIGKDIASLQDIMQPPKLRGLLGEVFLAELLRQLMPTCCEFQHRFKNGEAVDAVICVGERLIPIDAKFPLENFRKFMDEKDEDQSAKYKKDFTKDVKRHIDTIASKYILPDEGTYDFALMYIPAENIYYEIIAKDENQKISDYALKKRVIPVSPNTIYAYLQVILLGLRGLQIEHHAEDIMDHLSRLQGDFERFATDFDVLGSHITNADKKFNDAERRLDRLSEKLEATNKIAGKESPSEIDSPATSDEEKEAANISKT